MLRLSQALVWGSLMLGVLSSPRHSAEDDRSLVNWESFQFLLDSLDPSALHSVLHHLAPKFQDGVFSKDRAAIEHVHSENPIIASKLVHLAKKRQDSNSTTTSASQNSVNTVISSILSSEILASTVPGATTVTVPPAAPASATAVATTDGGVVFSTYGGGLVTLTSSAVGVRFTPSTSTHLFYATAADGSIQTSTSTVVVNAPLTGGGDATAAAGAAATTDSGPGLQNSAPSHQVGRLLMVFVGLGGWLLAL